MLECMRNAECEHMTLDEQISFCEEKSKNIKLKAEPQTFVDIKNSLEKLKNPWIPVSERLPEDGDARFYMCIVENHEEDPPMFCQYDEGCGFGFWRDYYDGDTLGFIDSEFQTNEELGYEKVVAWMPLPEPHRVSAEKSQPKETPLTEQPQTNADRIRSMTDEELALAVMCPADITGGDTKCDRYGNCRKCTLDWLQRESEE